MQCNKYEQEDIVSIWLNVYEKEKERQFIRRIDSFIPKNLVTLLDIGCGIGLHSYLWSERSKQVTASDFSTRFRDYFLRSYRFPFIWDDALNSTITGQYDICFCMAIGTILGEEIPRFQTFGTLSKLLHLGSFLVLITPANPWWVTRRSESKLMHSIDERDIAHLKQLGLEAERLFYWSSTPNWLWRAPGIRWLAKGIEIIAFHAGVGARKVLLCRKSS